MSRAARQKFGLAFVAAWYAAFILTVRVLPAGWPGPLTAAVSLCTAVAAGVAAQLVATRWSR